MSEKENLSSITFTHGMAVIDPALRIHYVEAGSGDRVIVLLHGFPQTWWEWRLLIPGLVGAGYRVIVPDYRGAGASWRPLTGYDKRTMAGDIHKVIKEQLQIESPVILIGHDIGLMVAYAYAQEYREDVSHLIVIDAIIPGTAVFDRIRSDHRVWHFSFHAVRDVPELLIAGRERKYLQAFFNARIFNVGAITEEDIDLFAAIYAAPGALRAGLELYRAFDQDILDNRATLQKKGKLTIPVLAVGGDISTSGPIMKEMAEEVATQVIGVRIPNTGHWIVEENPAALLDAVLDFLAR
ncbi:alpha/beta fold hydrolase [Chitinophaga nivalis]|uniref:Alpha/beta hydrolase n=1 Tax=Chitinophaga nivalis TaxID=2991709 RepID=A0ABT3IKY8_9BACT|nr:alpha/beta hydrolase [Chitinophaga nivalis]MCW3465689.1 alpha/beta hydrolase [Chitinophaga nivalis]MCW3484620.1 alpha/beta hydrolase [Chitinophaga nivalis]